MTKAWAGPLAALLLAAAPVAAQETVLEGDARTALDVTVYGGDLALVQDRRTVSLPAGEARLRLEDVSPRLQPDTAMLRLPGGARVAWQRLVPGRPDRAALLRRFEGGEVLLVRTGEDAQEYVTPARLLSAQPLLLEVEGRIETDPAGRIAFPSVPPDLAGEARLLAEVAADAPAEGEAALLYLTGGLSWAADYALMLAPDERSVDMDAFATLANEMGWALPEATLRLAAGEMTRAGGGRPMMMMRGDIMAAAPAAEAMPAERALLGMRFYTVPDPVALEAGEVRRVALLSARGVPAEMSYRHRAPAYGFHPNAQEIETRAERLLTVRNEEDEGLGRALPGGVVRVYGRGGDGGPRLVGEDRVGDTAPNRDLEVLLGRDIDLPVRQVQTEFRQLSARVYEAAYEVEIGNAKDEDVTVRVEQPFPGEWEVLSESLPHQRDNAYTAAWTVPVPAEGEAVLRYRVRVRR